MSKIKITCFYKNKRWSLEFDETMTMYDVLDYMVQKKYIPHGLAVMQRKRPPTYPDIHDGTELMFYDPSLNKFSGILYGCPTSKDRLGNVPLCMLTTFDGFVLSKV